MQITIDDRGNSFLVTLTGEMMLGYEANDFHEVILDAIEKKKERVVVDLHNVHFISSWGIGILIYGYTTAVNSGLKFRLARVPDHVNDVLNKVKLDKIFERFVSIEEALA